MATYQLIDSNGHVVNTVEWNGVNAYNIPVNYELILNSTAGIGWTYANGVFTPPTPPTPTPPSQQQLLTALDAHKLAVQQGGTTITVNGTPFAILTDTFDAMKLMGAFILAGQNNAYTAKIKTANGYVDFTNAQLLAVGAGAAAWMQKCDDVEAGLIPNVANYSTITDILAAFDTGMAS